jgi:2-haloalkanoic acid dehalogenase type II
VGRSYDVVTFDCYGTLIDWESGIGSWFQSKAAFAGVALSRPDALAAYAEIEPAVEAEAYRSYRQVLVETALRVGRRFGWRLTAREAASLVESLADWRPFPDTNLALERLSAAGYRLGILSNVDDDLLADTMRHFRVRFEVLVTAQQARSYKPAFGHFQTARQRIGAAPWLHAAQSPFHDVVPARALGIPVAWVNRKGLSALADVRPDIEVRSLAELVDRLEAMSA